MGVNNRINVTGYTYDGAGNFLSNGTNGMCGNSAQYGWDAESEMTCFGSYSYAYDGNGIRVKKSSGTL